MDGKISDHVTRYEGFGRSFNRSVLAKDERLHQDYKVALNNGFLPCNRLQIITVGDKGVGKTSTLKYLQGEVCDPNEEPKATEGIEITQCETSEQKPDWVACRDDGSPSSADDPTLSAAWCVCSNIDCFGGVLKRKEKDRESTKDSSDQPQNRPKGQTRKVPTLPHTTSDGINGVSTAFWWICTSVFTKMQLGISAFVLCLVVGYYFLLDFGVLCWLGVIMSYKLFLKSDFNSAYRFVTLIVFQIIFVEATIRATEYTSALEDSRPEYRVWAVVVATVLYSGVCAISTYFGLLCGLGCRSGIAIALCILTPTSKPSLSFEVLALAIGNFCGCLLVRFYMMFVQHMTRILKLAAMSLTVVVWLAWTGYLENLYVPVFFLGVFLGFGNACGVLKGREIVAVKKLMFSYVLKKAFGFVVGIIMGHLIGWRLMYFSETSTYLSIILSTISACGFLIYELSVAWKVWELEKNGIPITIFREFLMYSATGDNPTSIRLQLWDNAGDIVYQTMQQFFRPAEAVYLLVFNLEDAKEDEKEQLQRLRQWLFMVKAHSKNPNTLVFVVGTHRDSVGKEFIASFGSQIDEQLYNDFCSILAINGDKGPLYLVENSKAVDEDSLNLRQSIKRIAKKAPFMNEPFPIQKMIILNKIQEMQSDFHLPWIMTTSNLLHGIAREDLTLEELHKVLKCLHRTGDIIYRDDDDILKEYVIIRPQSLMDVLKAVVRIPPRDTRRLTKAEDLRALEVQGIASLKLIRAVVRSETLLPCVLRLMEAYNLLIPIYSRRSQLQPHEQDTEGSPSSIESHPSLDSGSLLEELPNHCILPSHLPAFTGADVDFWEPSPEDEEYFFDFGYVAPVCIFHRLLVKCWCDRDIHERVYKTRGRFRYQGANFYTIQLQKISVSQNTIQVIVLHDGYNRCSLQVLQFLYNLLEDIRSRDFPNLPYTCGPACRACSSGNYLRILKVCGDDKKFPTANMPFEAFMPQGKYHEVHLTPQLKVTCGRRRMSPSNLSINSQTDCRTPEDPVLTNQISVGETSNRVTVITAGSHARFDIHQSSLSQDADVQNA